MSEKRTKTFSILLRPEGKPISFELFPATQWPDGREGLFRVRVDDVWHCPTGKYSFLTAAAIGELVSGFIDGAAPADEHPPHVPDKADVTVDLDDMLLPAPGIVRGQPYQKRDGRWYVQVWVFGRGALEALCEDVTVKRVR